MKLHERLEQVDDEKTFLQFVHELITDRNADTKSEVDQLGRGGQGWENHTIEAFLEGACA